MNRRLYALLVEILSQPTAPFREGHIVSVVVRVLTEAGVPFFQDPVGNLIVGLSSPREYRRLARAPNAEPVRLFIAHRGSMGSDSIDPKAAVGIVNRRNTVNR